MEPQFKKAIFSQTRLFVNDFGVHLGKGVIRKEQRRLVIFPEQAHFFSFFILFGKIYF